MDQEKSGQFKAPYCILNVTGVKETDEHRFPSWLPENPIGRAGERR